MPENAKREEVLSKMEGEWPAEESEGRKIEAGR
jgi:hypothetical protein